MKQRFAWIFLAVFFQFLEEAATLLIPVYLALMYIVRWVIAVAYFACLRMCIASELKSFTPEVFKLFQSRSPLALVIDTRASSNLTIKQTQKNTRNLFAVYPGFQ